MFVQTNFMSNDYVVMIRYDWCHELC